MEPECSTPLQQVIASDYFSTRTPAEEKCWWVGCLSTPHTYGDRDAVSWPLVPFDKAATPCPRAAAASWADSRGRGWVYGGYTGDTQGYHGDAIYGGYTGITLLPRPKARDFTSDRKPLTDAVGASAFLLDDLWVFNGDATRPVWRRIPTPASRPQSSGFQLVRLLACLRVLDGAHCGACGQSETACCCFAALLAAPHQPGSQQLEREGRAAHAQARAPPQHSAFSLAPQDTPLSHPHIGDNRMGHVGYDQTRPAETHSVPGAVWAMCGACGSTPSHCA
jgi:hypothetical protein